MTITDIIGNLDNLYDLNTIINLNDRLEGFAISVLMESKNIHFIKQVIEKNTSIEHGMNELLKLERIHSCTMLEYIEFRKLIISLIQTYVQYLFDYSIDSNQLHRLYAFVSSLPEIIDPFDEYLMRDCKIMNKRLSMDDLVEILPVLYSKNIPSSILYEVIKTLDDSVETYIGSTRIVIHKHGSDTIIKIPKSSIRGVLENFVELHAYKLFSKMDNMNYLIPVENISATNLPLIQSPYAQPICVGKSCDLTKSMNDFIEHTERVYGFIIEDVIDNLENVGEWRGSIISSIMLKFSEHMNNGGYNPPLFIFL